MAVNSYLPQRTRTKAAGGARQWGGVQGGVRCGRWMNHPVNISVFLFVCQLIMHADCAATERRVESKKERKNWN